MINIYPLSIIILIFFLIVLAYVLAILRLNYDQIKKNDATKSYFDFLSQVNFLKTGIYTFIPILGKVSESKLEIQRKKFNRVLLYYYLLLVILFALLGIGKIYSFDLNF